MVTVEIGVLREDLRKGVQGSSEICAIARRLRMMGFRRVRVTKKRIRIGRARVEMAPKERRRLAKFVTWFDDFKAFLLPTTFTIRVAEHACPKKLRKAA